MATEKSPRNYIDDKLAAEASKVRRLRERIAILTEEKSSTAANIKLCQAELDVALGNLDRTSVKRDNGEQMLFPVGSNLIEGAFGQE